MQPVFPHLLLVFIYLASISCSQMPAYSSFPEKVLILIAIIIALSMCEFWVLLYLFPILTATVQNSITLILHINWDIGRLRDLFHGQWKWNVSRSVMSTSVVSWTVACQAPPFSRQEYWSGLPFPSPRNLPNPGIKPRSLELQAYTLLSEPPGKPHFMVREPTKLESELGLSDCHVWSVLLCCHSLQATHSHNWLECRLVSKAFLTLATSVPVLLCCFPQV